MVTREEKVLCLSRKALEAKGLLEQQVRPLKGLKELLCVTKTFIPRNQAEKDEAWKQLIPYQLFMSEEKFLVFQRGAKVNEQRLAGRFSVGIGGHINDQDLLSNEFDFLALNNAAERERNEELIITGDIEEIYPLGLINDDSDSVGRVHLGLVFICRLSNRSRIKIREGAEDLLFKGLILPQNCAAVDNSL